MEKDVVKLNQQITRQIPDEIKDVWTSTLEGHWDYFVQFDEEVETNSSLIRIKKEVPKSIITYRGMTKIDGQSRSINGSIKVCGEDASIFYGEDRKLQRKFFVREDLTYLKIHLTFIPTKQTPAIPDHLLLAIEEKILDICRKADQFIKCKMDHNHDFSEQLNCKCNFSSTS